MDKINKKFKPMMCPVCDGMYFSGPNKNSFDEDLEEYLNGEVQCRHCGWIYDLHQAENPDSKEGFNEMSVNEYKEWFDNKIKENPNYDYFEEQEHNPDEVTMDEFIAEAMMGCYSKSGRTSLEQAVFEVLIEKGSK